jgi:methylthioribose-1-phosphate isomerase
LFRAAAREARGERKAGSMARLTPIEWTGSAARILDQTQLPTQLRYEDVTSAEEMFTAIRELKVRGAPLIGVSAAFGLYLGVASFPESGSRRDILALVDARAAYLASSRPTAVNLFWALKRMQRCAGAVAPAGGVQGVKQALLAEARLILTEDQAMCRRIGELGFDLLKECGRLLTHCNAGGLATSGLGTALAPVYVGKERGKTFEVYVDETRPLLQGARITALELMQAGIPATLICDNMAAAVMARKNIDAVIVGADRIAANGDVANKIGTYGLAIIAHAHAVPFYVAAPSSTIDATLASGSEIPIEERGGEEVTCGMGRQTAPDGVAVYNPAFDVTPHHLVTAIITETGVVRPPYRFCGAQ